MGLRPLYIFNAISARIDFRRQILTSNVSLRTEKVKLHRLNSMQSQLNWPNKKIT